MSQPTPQQASRQRLRRLLVAGWIDSLCLSFAWTLALLEIVDRYGLEAAGLAAAAMLVGTALAAPAASYLSQRLSGRQLLRFAAAFEGLLRAAVFLLLGLHAPVGLILVCVVGLNVNAWTGYAGMRAEVLAVSPGPKALTWYATGVLALEAVGAAVAGLAPASLVHGLSFGTLTVVVVYVAALVPTVVVAGGSTITATRVPVRGLRAGLRPSRPMVAGVVLMLVASGPTLLFVALAAQMFGRSAVAPAAIAFTVGSFCAPLAAAWVQRRSRNGLLAWSWCGVVMVLFWPLAPLGLALLCAAQFASGLGVTALEGLIDARVAAGCRSSTTGALARATAGRALGAAAGTALLPAFVSSAGWVTTTLSLTAVLAVGMSASIGLARWRRAPATASAVYGAAEGAPGEVVAALP